MNMKEDIVSITDIISAIRNNKIRITEHADDEAYNDNLTFDEIFYSVSNGEIIKLYSDDKPYPSCLLLGKNYSDEPIHSVWGYNKQNGWAILITVYRPDQSLWVNFKKRR
jgi:hypothetical protein